MSSLLSVVVIAISLALDALAVSIAGGVRVGHARWRDALKVGLFFGAFQAGMPLLGYLAGNTFKDAVASVDGLIAFVLLVLIGLNMIRVALTDGDDDDDGRDILPTRTLLLLAVATSIDALVVGVSLSLVALPLLVSVVVIGVVTFAISVAGYLFGTRLGTWFGSKIEILGGLALIGIGLKLLLS